MARLIPSTIHSSVRSGAERRLFHLIQQSEDLQDWVCLHSLGLARHARKRRGELDFVLISRRGLIVLEVKGGRVRRQDGEWIFTDRYNEAHRRAESPFDQASSGMFALETSLRKEFGYQFTKELLLGYAVAFPDVEFDARGVDCDPRIVYDRTDRGRPFSGFLNRVLEFARSCRRTATRQLKPEQVDALVGYLRGDFDFCPTFETLATDVRQELDRLTSEQMAVLDASALAPRLVVEGPAGSGKTVLALEESRRAARQGARVLFLCFNRFLACLIRSLLEAESYSGTAVVRTIHNHCGALIAASSLCQEFEDERGKVDAQMTYDELLPFYAAMAADEDVERPFDLVVVDEGQDVLTDVYCNVISSSIAGGLEQGKWRVFFDINNQAGVFGNLDEGCIDRLRRGGRSVVLTSNCRNTREIAFQVNAVTAPAVRSIGRVAGVPVEFVYYDDEGSFISGLRSILDTLRDDAVPPGRQTVLFPRVPNPALQTEMSARGVARLRDDDAAQVGRGIAHATWTTVSAFKGLENDVVVLAGVEELETNWWSAVIYVGMSRARARLFVLMSEGCRQLQTTRLQDETARLLSGRQTTLP